MKKANRLKKNFFKWRTGANIKGMTGTVISAPLELAQKLKRGNLGSSSDNVGEGGESMGHSRFYASSSKSNGSPAVQKNGSVKAKSSTLPASMRMATPVDTFGYVYKHFTGNEVT